MTLKRIKFKPWGRRNKWGWLGYNFSRWRVWDAMEYMCETGNKLYTDLLSRKQLQMINRAKRGRNKPTFETMPIPEATQQGVEAMMREAGML